ncbi:MAG: hypothetical protein ABIJ47_04990 [Candidatus Bathyarchaeota archaeon]
MGMQKDYLAFRSILFGAWRRLIDVESDSDLRVELNRRMRRRQLRREDFKYYVEPEIFWCV